MLSLMGVLLESSVHKKDISTKEALKKSFSTPYMVDQRGVIGVIHLGGKKWQNNLFGNDSKTESKLKRLSIRASVTRDHGEKNKLQVYGATINLKQNKKTISKTYESIYNLILAIDDKCINLFREEVIRNKIFGNKVIRMVRKK